MGVCIANCDTLIEHPNPPFFFEAVNIPTSPSEAAKRGKAA